MKLSYKLAVGMSVLAAAGVAIYVAKWYNKRKMLTQIAEEGYETAHDILFPGKQLQGKYLQYGPVIPD